MIKWGYMVLKGVRWVHNDKIRSNGLERSQLDTQLKKTGQIVLKGVNCVHKNCFERSQLGSQ